MHFCKGRAIIITFQFGAHNTSEYGGLAQLVRAPASHAGGLGFESLILHHTVRTRTRFFTKKGSGTFFVYRRFAFATATNTPVGCLSNRTVCVSRWRGFAPTSSATRVRRTVNEQRQGIIMAMVSCLLFCGITFALCKLGRPLYGSLGAIAAYVRTGSLYTSGKV